MLPNELLSAGVQEAIEVDASAAYIEAAKEEAARQNHADRIRFYQGDFLRLASNMPRADIVTLDRMICCYHDMGSLVGLSCTHARKFYGVVLPRETWWLKFGIWIENLFYQVQRNPFRVYVHPMDAVERVIRNHGFIRHFYCHTLVWQVAVYVRETGT